MIHRLHEFFESDEGQLSMSRLLCFMSFFPASYVFVIRQTDDMMLYFLGAFVLGYIGGKGADVYAGRKVSKNDPAPKLVDE